MNRYVLSEKTQEDIENIYEYGCLKFGEKQALDYLFVLKNCFESLSENPDIGKHRNEIKEGLFSLPYVSHIVFYRILPDHIRIVRVLHGSRDFKKLI